jgi:hypothetical protein
LEYLVIYFKRLNDDPFSLEGELLDPGYMTFGLKSGGVRTNVKID